MKLRLRAWAAPLALGLLMLAGSVLASGCWLVYSNTWDEPEHLAAGIELLDRGLYQYDTEHPPLGRILLALPPYVAGARSFGTPPPDGTREGVDILYDGGHYWRTLTLARLGTLGFLALLLYATWLWARRLFPAAGTSLLAVVLLLSVPPLLGHAALASLDVAAAATMMLALYLLVRWLVSGAAGDAALFGVAAGAAVATKFSAVPFVGLSLAVLLALQAVLACLRRQSFAPVTAGVRARGVALAALAAMAVLFLVYGPRSSDPAGVALRYNWALSYLSQGSAPLRLLGTVLAQLWLPRELKDLVNGLVAVEAHNNAGHLSFLLGQVGSGGWWYFYPVALAVKTPVPLLVAGPLGLCGMAHEGWRRGAPWQLAPPVIALTVLVFASAFSRINIGIRHVLLLYPLLALGGAYVAWHAWRASARLKAVRAALARAALLALLIWQLGALWYAYPDYLPYFNELTAHPEQVLVDSDLDWGQDLYRLERRAAQLGIERLSLAYRGSADLAREPLPPLYILPPRQPVTGWVAISQLARTRNRDDYAWLVSFRPVERIGKTIDLYYIP